MTELEGSQVYCLSNSFHKSGNQSSKKKKAILRASWLVRLFICSFMQAFLHSFTEMNILNVFSSVQSLSHVWLFATPWTATPQASLSLTISWSLPKFMSTECMMLCDWPSYPLPPSSPSVLSLSQCQGLFQWVACPLHIANISLKGAYTHVCCLNFCSCYGRERALDHLAWIASRFYAYRCHGTVAKNQLLMGIAALPTPHKGIYLGSV